MKIRLADYVADFLVENGITHCFTVTGGGAMHLNDALGHREGLSVTYTHHEQAAAMAAEAYARPENRPAAVCVTTGPGGTNAITGVLGGWLDSIPMLILSGQVRYDTTARAMGVGIRAGGDQEFDITRAVASMTKYAEMLTDPRGIRHALEKALYLATHGRPGPAWLDIPVDLQGALIEAEDLAAFDPATAADPTVPPPLSKAVAAQVLQEIAAAKRPIFYAGNGIRLSGAFPLFEALLPRLGIPVVTCWNSIDLVPDTDPLFAGRGGIMGDRAGNFAVQNADLILAVGTRLSIRQVGYNSTTWARAARVIMADTDAEELKKPTLHVEMPLHADARELLERLLDLLPTDGVFHPGGDWPAQCRKWRKTYPVVTLNHYEAEGEANVYAFMDALSHRLPEGSITVVGNGSASVVGSQAFRIKRGSRFLINSGAAAMGYDLPAAIGASRALGDAPVIVITGDGSIQMNLQELQTILTNRLPIRIFVINNDGYHSIRQTQQNLFPASSRVGIGPESGDLDFPSLERLAAAYGYPYRAIRSNADLGRVLTEALAAAGPSITEIFVTTVQGFEPKSAARRLPDGRLVSPPLEDLFPHLPPAELSQNMFIPTAGEK